MRNRLRLLCQVQAASESTRHPAPVAAGCICHGWPAGKFLTAPCTSSRLWVWCTRGQINLAVEAFQGCGTARSCSFKPPAKQHAAVGASAGLNLQDLHGLPLCSLRTQSSWEASHTRKCTVMMRPHVISSSCSLNGMKDV